MELNGVLCESRPGPASDPGICIRKPVAFTTPSSCSSICPAISSQLALAPQPLSELLPSTCSSSPAQGHLSFLLALGHLRTLEPSSWESASLSAPPLASSRTPPTLEDPTFQPGLCTFSVPRGPVSQSPFSGAGGSWLPQPGSCIRTSPAFLLVLPSPLRLLLTGGPWGNL